MVLKPLLVLGFQTDEFDSHTNSRIAGANQGACRNPFHPNPQFHAQTGSDGKGRKRLDIATVAADIGSGDAGRDRCPLVAQSDQDGNLVTTPSPAAWSRGGRIPISRGKQSDPWAFLLAQKLHAHLNLPNRTGIRRPHYLASRFLVAGLHSHSVANLEVMLDLAKQRAGGADIVGTSMLGKSTSIRAHAPHTHV